MKSRDSCLLSRGSWLGTVRLGAGQVCGTQHELGGSGWLDSGSLPGSLETTSTFPRGVGIRNGSGSIRQDSLEILSHLDPLDQEIKNKN